MFSLIDKKMCWNGLALSEMKNVEEIEATENTDEVYRITKPDDSVIDVVVADLTTEEHRFFEAFISQFLEEGLNYETELSRLKQVKIAELSDACTDNILNGFSSDAFESGVFKVYDFDERDQDNLVAMMSFSTTPNGNLLPYYWKAKGECVGYPWTVVQIVKLCEDAYMAKIAKVSTYHLLRVDVLACTTKEEVAAIVWTDL